MDNRKQSTVNKDIEGEASTENFAEKKAQEENFAEKKALDEVTEEIDPLFSMSPLIRTLLGEEEEAPHHVAFSFNEKERIRLHDPAASAPRSLPHILFHEDTAFKKEFLEQQQREFERRRIKSFDARAIGRRKGRTWQDHCRVSF